MIKISITNFRKNFCRYINLSKTRDVQITKYGKVVAVLSNSDSNFYGALIRLAGSLATDEPIKDYKTLIGDEIMKRCGY